MDRQSWKIRFRSSFASMALIVSVLATPATAQVPVDANGNPLGGASALSMTGTANDQLPLPLSAAELAGLVGPVALYPDDLLAIVLPASTYPLEIVQAARFLDQYEQDSTLKPNEDWDESVTALLNYPEVVRMMNDDIDWTWKLGDAVVNQQSDVIAAVETFRDRAYAAGNLKSDQYQTVREGDGVIEIVPVNNDIIYIPYYEPERVLVRQVTPVYYYYPRPYPVYYYPYPVGFSFYNGYFWGVTTAYRIGWSSHLLHVHHHSYWGHPYFGHSYYGHYYRRPSVQVYNTWYVNNPVHYSSNRYRDGDYWRPRTSSRARPAYYASRTRSYRDEDVRRGSSRGTYNASPAARIAANRTSRSNDPGPGDVTRRRDDTRTNAARPGTTNERIPTEQGSSRQPRRDAVDNAIRFRERAETRPSAASTPDAPATRPAENRPGQATEQRRTVTAQPAQQEARNRSQAVAREAPAVRREVPATQAAVQNRSVPATRITVQNRSAPAPQATVQNRSAPAPQAPVQNRSAPAPQAPVQNRSTPAPQAPVQNRSAPAPQAPVQNRSAPAPQAPVQNRSAPAPRESRAATAAARSESRPAAQASVRQGDQGRRGRN